MENMPAVHMEKQQCPLAKGWFPHMHVRGQPLCTFLERYNKKRREKEGKPFPPTVPNLPPTPGKSQAIQHLQVKLLGIAMVTKLGDLHLEPVPPKPCRSCRTVGEGKEKYLKRSSGIGS